MPKSIITLVHTFVERAWNKESVIRMLPNGINRTEKKTGSRKLQLLFQVCTFFLALTTEAVYSADNKAGLAKSLSRCASLQIPEQVILEEKPSWVSAEGLPRYCKVRGTISRRVKFELRMPEDWNGRFLMAGCGGFCGELMPDSPGYGNSINHALKRGYAAIAHDSGHQAPGWQTEWARNDPEALELWAHRVLPVVVEVGVAISESLYGQAPHHKYYSGCSNGGRLGLMAAQRYPDLFDGIAAGGSIFDLSGITGYWGGWMISQAYTRHDDGLTPVLQQSKLPFVEQAVLRHCDLLDGQKDRIIRDPRACEMDFRSLQCQSSAEDEACLLASEADMLNRLYGGVKSSNEELLYPVLSLGSEHYSGMWIFGAGGEPGLGVSITQQYLIMLAESVGAKLPASGVTSDEAREWIGESPLPAITDAVNPDLSGIHQSGAKLFMYHGWSDPLVIPEPVVNYYEQAADLAGGLKKLQTDARLFMVPGMGHCWEIPTDAPVNFDPLLAIEQWVESGRAPNSIIARTQVLSNEEGRSRPICAYPAVAELIRGENPDMHSSYHCVTGNHLE